MENKEKIIEAIKNIERVAGIGQELARSAMDREPSQRSQNANWRIILQEIRDLKKFLFPDEKF